MKCETLPGGAQQSLTDPGDVQPLCESRGQRPAGQRMVVAAGLSRSSAISPMIMPGSARAMTQHHVANRLTSCATRRDKQKRKPPAALPQQHWPAAAQRRTPPRHQTLGRTSLKDVHPRKIFRLVRRSLSRPIRPGAKPSLRLYERQASGLFHLCQPHTTRRAPRRGVPHLGQECSIGCGPGNFTEPLSDIHRTGSCGRGLTSSAPTLTSTALTTVGPRT